MKKLCGAAAIILACFWTALDRLREKRKRIRLMRRLASSLLELQGELAEHQSSLSGCFRSLAAKNAGDAVGGFYAALCGEMLGLGELRFSEIWRMAAEKCFAPAGEAVPDALRPLGALLGGSELERQCAALERASRRLEQEAETQRNALKNERRLCFGLSLSAGAFLVIMLM